VRKSLQLAGLLAAGAIAVGLSGCGAVTDPDKIGIYYNTGSIEGFKFDHCTIPGAVDKQPVNDEIIWLPNNMRTWNIAPQGGDTATPITVQSAPEKDQPSGVQVNLWTQTNFMLNTNCSDANSPLVQWWERIGKRYHADSDQGWKDMLYATLVPALEKSTRTVVRSYKADELVAGVVLADVQTKISAEFQTELKRLVGGDYFCGPNFVRGNPACPEVQVLVKDVDYSDPGIQEARNKKQQAIEAAAAAVAEAEGKVRAAAAQNALYQNEAWMQLELAKLQLAQVQACAASPNCTVFIGGNPGGMIVQAK